MNRRVCQAGIMAMMVSLSVNADPGWATYPDVTVRDVGPFQDVHRQASESVVELLVAGDSQETWPNGLGNVYGPCLSAYLNGPGNVPRTAWIPAGLAYGGGQPFAAFLVRTASAAPGVATSPRATLANTPAGQRFCTTSAVNGANVNNNQWYGWLVCLDHDAQWTKPGANLQGVTWMDVSAGVYVHVTGRTFPGSSELSFRVSTTTGAPTYYGTFVSSHTTTLGLDSAEGRFLTQTFGPFNVPAGTKLQVEVFGSDPAKFADIATVRFSSVAHTTGYVVTPFSAGGYRSDSFLAFHGDTEEWLRAINPAMMWQTYGANDVGQEVTPAAYASHLMTNMTWARSVLGDIPVALIPDVYRNLQGAPGSHYDYLDEYNDAAFSFASDPGLPAIMYINSRRMTEEIGWSATGSPWLFLSDGVHYTDRGGRDKAAIDAAAFLRAVEIPEIPCKADFNGDGFIDFFDFDDYLSAFELGEEVADFNGDGFIDFFDYDEFVSVFELGC